MRERSSSVILKRERRIRAPSISPESITDRGCFTFQEATVADPHDLAAHDRELSRLVEARRQVRDRLIRKDTPADRLEYAELTAEMDARLDERNRIAGRLAEIRSAVTMMTARP